MRSLWLILPALVLVAGCNDKAETQNSGAVDQMLADDPLTGNDLTAIDAVSASDANIAADVEYNALENGSEGNSAAGNASTRSRKTAPSSKPTPSPAASDTAADVDTTAETTNAT